MNVTDRIRGRISHLIESPVYDDEFRRRKMLNLLILCVAAIVVVSFTFFVLMDLMNDAANPDAVIRLYLGYGVFSINLIVIYYINNNESTRIASYLFLFLFTFVIVLSDVPMEIIEGRGLFLFSIPILASSILIKPMNSFIWAGINSIIITALAREMKVVPNVGAMGGFFTLAVVSWLLARSLDNALDELRSINADLDLKIEERTAELQDANKRLSNLSKMKTRFVSTATHELRTPLTSMKGFLELAMDQDLPDQASKYLDVVVKNTERLEALTETLLDQQRLEEGRLNLFMETIDLNSVIADVEEEMSCLLTENMPSVHVRTQDSPVLVKGDKMRLHQVFVNLIDNAMNYSPEGSTITVTISRNSKALVSIDDEGIGFDPEDIEKLFKPFPGIQRPVTTKQSVGLGLSICKGIIDLHGGDIWAESDGPGEGSRFMFSLPVID